MGEGGVGRVWAGVLSDVASHSAGTGDTSMLPNRRVERVGCPKMSSSFMRLAYTLFFLAIFSTPGYSQISLVGPETATPGDLTKIQVKLGGSTDLKVSVLLNGKPTTQGYTTVKELDDTPVVMFFTKQQGTYTILATGLKDGKQQVVIYVLT